MWVMECLGHHQLAPVGLLLSLHSICPVSLIKERESQSQEGSFLGHMLIGLIFLLKGMSSHLISLFWGGSPSPNREGEHLIWTLTVSDAPYRSPWEVTLDLPGGVCNSSFQPRRIRIPGSPFFFFSLLNWWQGNAKP